jgi:hypothetical protein
MNKIRVGIALAAALTQAACASSPDSIDARYVSPSTYQAWSCPQLYDEKIRLTREVERVSGLQRENANADAAMMGVGLILFWPALFGLAATKDRKDELGRLKGEYEAVDNNIRAKQCTAPPPGGVSTAAAPSQPMANYDGKYEGKGKTASYCQTPSLSLMISGTEVAGTLSEVSSGAPTGAVTGEVDRAGQLTLNVKSANPTQVNGTFRGDMAGGMLNVAMKNKEASVCNHQFALEKAK